MRLETIDGVGSGTADNLFEAGFRQGEDLAYGYLPDILAVDGVDVAVVENAYRKISEFSNLSGKRAVKQQQYFGSCGAGDFVETGAQSHMEDCPDCGEGRTDIGVVR